jgi:hypothetical protein
MTVIITKILQAVFLKKIVINYFKGSGVGIESRLVITSLKSKTEIK